MRVRLMNLGKNRHGIYEYRKVIPPQLRHLLFAYTRGRAYIRFNSHDAGVKPTREKLGEILLGPVTTDKS